MVRVFDWIFQFNLNTETQMATSYMLSIDKKRTDKVSFEKPLSKWIEKEESYKVADFQEALNELDKLREDVRNAVEKSENTLPIHYRYLIFR